MEAAAILYLYWPRDFVHGVHVRNDHKRKYSLNVFCLEFTLRRHIWHDNVWVFSRHVEEIVWKSPRSDCDNIVCMLGSDLSTLETCEDKVSSAPRTLRTS